jgi:hypothetical protein
LRCLAIGSYRGLPPIAWKLFGFVDCFVNIFVVKFGIVSKRLQNL